MRKYVAHCLLLKQKQPDAASRLLSLQRSKRWDPWTGNNFFSITKQMFAAFYFNRSRNRVDKQSLRGEQFLDDREMMSSLTTNKEREEDMG